MLPASPAAALRPGAPARGPRPPPGAGQPPQGPSASASALRAALQGTAALAAAAASARRRGPGPAVHAVPQLVGGSSSSSRQRQPQRPRTARAARMTQEEAEREAAKNAMAFLTAETDPAPILESEFQVASLLNWARGQPSMLVHPAIVARGPHLATSMPIKAGTPLIGVKPEQYLNEMLSLPKAEEATAAEGECHRLTKAADKPSMWNIRLAVRLLKEANDPESPWQAYIQCLAERPRSPLLWSVTQANELQYLPAKREVKDQLMELRAFHETHLESNPLGPQSSDLVSFAALVATAGSRGIEVEPGRRALMPLVDLVCPPEGPVAAGQAPRPPSCELALEGGEDGLAILTAARDLAAGEVLTRDHGLTHDQLLLQHGLAGAKGSAKDEVVLWAGIGEMAAKPWHLRELRRAVTTEAGASAGDLIVRSSVKRGRKISEAIGRGLIHSSRVLACAKESELRRVAEWAQDEKKASKGLTGLGSEQRRGCIINLVHAIEGYMKIFDTTLEKDDLFLPTITGNWQVAVAYRLEKKRVLQDVLELLERAKDREVEKRARRKEEAHLPAALTGRKSSPQVRSFQKGESALFPDLEAEKVKGDDKPRITKGARVEITKGKHKGAVGVVTTEPNTFGSVNVLLENGKSVDYVSLKLLRLVEPAPEEVQKKEAQEEEAREEEAQVEEAEVEVMWEEPRVVPFVDQRAPAEALDKKGRPRNLTFGGHPRAPSEGPPVVAEQASEAPPADAQGVQVVDVEPAAADEAAEPVPADAGGLEVVDTEPQAADEAAEVQPADAGGVEVVNVEPPAADEAAAAAAEPPAPPAGEPEAAGEARGGAGAEPETADEPSALEDYVRQLQELQASTRELERQKMKFAMQAAGVEEEKMQKVMAALDGNAL